MNSYDAWKAAKAERLAGYAENAKKRSDAAFSAVHAIADGIPMGQPILVGHHSEKRHRRALEKMDNGMRRGIEESEKAAKWASAAASVESDTSIAREDPEAITKLREKVAELEATRDRIKMINAALRRGDRSMLTKAELANIEVFIRVGQASPTRPTYPAYCLSNLNGNLRRYKQRLEALERQAAAPPAIIGYAVVAGKFGPVCHAVTRHDGTYAGALCMRSLWDVKELHTETSGYVCRKCEQFAENLDIELA